MPLATVEHRVTGLVVCLTLCILPSYGAPCSLTLDPAALPAAKLRTALRAPITAAGGAAPHAYAVTAGALPPSLTVVSDGG